MTATETTTPPDLGPLFAALAKAQGQMKVALKDSANPFFKSKYADLTSVWEACREALSVNGLSVVQFPVNDGELVGIKTILGHSSGTFLESVVYSKPTKQGPQELGSVLTYLRRYALAAAVGVTADDDDGNAGNGRAEGKAPPQAAASATPADGKTEPTTETAPSTVKPGPVRHDGTKASQAQIRMLHALKTKLGMQECDGKCARETVKVTKTRGQVPITVRCVYHAQLAKFEDQAGKPITTSKDLSISQMRNLIDRYQAQADKNQEKTDNLPDVDLGAVMEREPGSDDEEMADPGDLADLEEACFKRWGAGFQKQFPAWLKGAFDYDGVMELRKDEAIEAIRMIREGK